MTLQEQFEQETGLSCRESDKEEHVYDQDLELGSSWEYVKWLESRVPQWINVKDKLPEKSGNYIIHNFEFKNTYEAYFNGISWLHTNGDRIYDCVDMWQEMPADPVKEGKT